MLGFVEVAILANEMFNLYNCERERSKTVFSADEYHLGLKAALRDWVASLALAMTAAVKSYYGDRQIMYRFMSPAVYLLRYVNVTKFFLQKKFPPC